MTAKSQLGNVRHKENSLIFSIVAAMPIVFDGVYFLVFIALLTLLFKGVGEYLGIVLDPSSQGYFGKSAHKLLRIQLYEEQTWQQYLRSVLIFSAISGTVTCGILYFQSHFPLNPQAVPDLPFPLAFNTAVSFLTNTDWQAYAGERELSYFSQMMALTVQNFFSPALSLCVAVALCRGIVREETKTLGNFWIDFVRILFYLLLPLSIVLALLFIQQGTPQNFSSYLDVTTWQSGAHQLLVQGPIASQEAIKVLGTSGGGFTGVNSAHPYENPTYGTNFLQILSFFMIAVGQLYYFGKKISCLKAVSSLYGAILVLLTVGVIASTFFEREIASLLSGFGISTSLGNLEGKEMRFQVFGSCFYTIATMLTSCGAVNAMQSSFTPLGGLISLANIQLSKLVFGGVGMGLSNIVLFSLLICFFIKLFLGKKPLYLGKSIGVFEAGMAVLSFAVFFLSIAIFSSATLSRDKPRISEVVYAYSSTSANNGSAFTSLKTDTPWYNYTLACTMLVGRFGTLIPVLALAGCLAKKKRLSLERKCFPVKTVALCALFIASAVVVGLIFFLPTWFFGPIMEEMHMLAEPFR